MKRRPWTLHEDEDGLVFYHNPETGKSQWTSPSKPGIPSDAGSISRKRGKGAGSKEAAKVRDAPKEGRGDLLDRGGDMSGEGDKGEGQGKRTGQGEGVKVVGHKGHYELDGVVGDEEDDAGNGKSGGMIREGYAWVAGPILDAEGDQRSRRHRSVRRHVRLDRDRLWIFDSDSVHDRWKKKRSQNRDRLWASSTSPKLGVGDGVLRAREYVGLWEASVIGPGAAVGREVQINDRWGRVWIIGADSAGEEEDWENKIAHNVRSSCIT